MLNFGGTLKHMCTWSGTEADSMMTFSFSSGLHRGDYYPDTRGCSLSSPRYHNFTVALFRMSVAANDMPSNPWYRSTSAGVPQAGYPVTANLTKRWHDLQNR